MNKKFKLATRRITAVAASTALVSSAVAGAPLANYPSNFNQDGEFQGSVVVGSDAAASDTTAAESLISDLESEFSGEQQQVEISYREDSNNGESLSAIRNNNALNYGENLGNVTETSGYDNSDANVLEDGTFNNGISDEDYEQTLTLKNGEFHYALRDSVDDVEEIADGLYYANDDVFASYSLELDNQLDLSGSDADEELIGEDLEIMGNTFTVGDISIDGSDDVSELQLIGGSNKMTIGEGKSSTVTSKGEEYTIEIQSVSSTSSSDKVLLTVNGESKTINEFDTEDVAGVTVAVTELVPSSRDSVKGYAEIVLGGQKVTLQDSNSLVQVNDEDIDDVYEGYEVQSNFKGSGLDTMEITYKVSDNTLLEQGERLNDVLFDTFNLQFDGTNEPEYKTIKISSSSGKLSVKGENIDGETFDQEIARLYDENAGTSTATFLMGDREEDAFLVDDVSSTSLNNSPGLSPTNSYINGVQNSSGNFFFLDLGVAYIDSSNTMNGISLPTTLNESVNIGNYEVKYTNDFNDNGNTTDDNGGWFITSIDLEEADGIRFLSGDGDEQLFYQFESYDDTDEEIDFEDIYTGNKEEDVDTNEIASSLEYLDSVTYNGNHGLTDMSTIKDSLLMANEYRVNLTYIATDGTTSSSGGSFTIDTDSGDLDADKNGDFPTLKFETLFDTDDDNFDIKFDEGASTLPSYTDAKADVSIDNDDVQEFVDKYGTKIKTDSEDYEWVEVKTPNEQVEAKASLSFGDSSASEMSVTVSEDAVEDKRAELEDDGYTITGTEEVSSEEVEFNVSAPEMDSDVAGTQDLIVVGGPAVNAKARELMGIDNYSVDQAGVAEGEGVARYFEEENSVLIYGYSAADTQAIVENVNAGTANFE